MKRIALFLLLAMAGGSLLVLSLPIAAMFAWLNPRPAFWLYAR